MDKILQHINTLISSLYSEERPLNNEEKNVAEFIGIKNPENIRIIYMTQDGFRNMLGGEARKIIDDLGMVNNNTNGITFGNRIFIFNSKNEKRTAAHELVHVYQYQKLGIERFVKIYWAEIKTGVKKNQISLEIPAYDFANIFMHAGYSTKALNRDNFRFVPE